MNEKKKEMKKRMKTKKIKMNPLSTHSAPHSAVRPFCVTSLSYCGYLHAPRHRVLPDLKKGSWEVMDGYFWSDLL